MRKIRVKKTVLELAREKFRGVLKETGLADDTVQVSVKGLVTEEAIGRPKRRDFPIITGKERVVEACFKGARAHVFTDSPREYSGRLSEALDISLDTNRSRAVFIAVMNAVLKHLGVVGDTLHCKDDDPEKCASVISSYLKGELGLSRVGLVGLNPAILEALSRAFGHQNVMASDINRDNIGKTRYGVEILDGNNASGRLAEFADAVLVTGTTLVNGTFDGILEVVRRRRKDCLVYGVTSAGVCKLLGLGRICPFAGK